MNKKILILLASLGTVITILLLGSLFILSQRDKVTYQLDSTGITSTESPIRSLQFEVNYPQETEELSLLPEQEPERTQPTQLQTEIIAPSPEENKLKIRDLIIQAAVSKGYSTAADAHWSQSAEGQWICIERAISREVENGFANYDLAFAAVTSSRYLEADINSDAIGRQFLYFDGPGTCRSMQRSTN